MRVSAGALNRTTAIGSIGRLANGDIGIVTILHERMHRIDRFHGDFGV